MRAVVVCLDLQSDSSVQLLECGSPASRHPLKLVCAKAIPAVITWRVKSCAYAWKPHLPRKRIYR